MDKKDKRKKILKVAGLIGLFLIVFGLSYALFTVTLNGTKKVKISTGRLELQLLDSNNNPIYITDQNNTTSYEINLDNQVPVSDEVGLDTQAFEFKLKNSGSVKASYTIYLDDVALEEGEERLADEYVRYSLTKNGSEENPQGLSTRELDKGTIEANNTINEYTLKIWIAEDATNEAMDKVFNATLRVEGTQYVAPPASEYGVEIASTQLSETITATYYQPEDTGYNSTSKIKRMSNVERYEGGTLVISGTGDMPGEWDEDSEDWKIHAFLAGLDSISGVQFYDGEPFFIDDNSFEYKYNPTTVIVSEGITSIGYSTFERLRSIENILLPSTLRIIYEGAFIGISVSNLILPDGLQELDYYVFEDASITEIRVPSSLITINEGAFNSASISKIFMESEVVNCDGPIAVLWADDAVIYCKTQTCYDNLQSQQPLLTLSRNVNLLLDPTKFE